MLSTDDLTFDAGSIDFSPSAASCGPIFFFSLISSKSYLPAVPCRQSSLHDFSAQIGESASTWLFFFSATSRLHADRGRRLRCPPFLVSRSYPRVRGPFPCGLVICPRHRLIFYPSGFKGTASSSFNFQERFYAFFLRAGGSPDEASCFTLPGACFSAKPPAPVLEAFYTMRSSPCLSPQRSIVQPWAVSPVVLLRQNS